MSFRLITDGDWAFADADVVEMAGQDFESESRSFRGYAGEAGNSDPFSVSWPRGCESVERRNAGRHGELLMGKVPSKIGALAQISTPLTHEMFHLWVPNGLCPRR